MADARGLGPRAPIGPEAVAPYARAGAVLLIATGWARHWGEQEYLAHPYLTPEAAALIVEAGCARSRSTRSAWTRPRPRSSRRTRSCAARTS
ncbi:cyclase family protein [Thermocatellispora tengchongensis]|uniref:cyclase family protein n=1 Tax=Thermocatellispora tengchongensis TaxID=1073253 RepID=UPI003642BF27